jgi:cytoskeletal protein RodZ
MLQNFDKCEATLGDVMRGERATLGKTITDVRLEFRLSKKYILAIESGDISAFRCLKFVPGYVRSYAHYLGLNPDQAFATFCIETGFSLGSEQERNMMAFQLHSSSEWKIFYQGFLAYTS